MTDIPLLQRQPLQDVVCDFVSGYAFGDCIGVAIQSLSGWWTVTEVRAQSQGVIYHSIPIHYFS